MRVMRDYEYMHVFRGRQFKRKLILFHTEMIAAYFLWGNVLLKGELQIDAQN